MNIKNLPDRIVDSICSPEILDIGLDLVEIRLDQILDDDLLKDLPIVGSIVKIFKGTLDVRERIFIAKIAKFLFRLNDVPLKNRDRFRSKVSSDPKLKRRVGDALILILERLDDLDKPDIVAKCFSAYLSNRITFSEFRRLAVAIDMAFIDDLKNLLRRGDKNPEDLSFLSRTGLVDFKAAGIEGTWNNLGTIKYSLSSLGQLFTDIIQNYPNYKP
jgi:hypothetical protein